MNKELKPSFSIGLIYYEGIEYLLPCIESLFSQCYTGSYEILIRDQSPRKEAAFFISSHFEKELKNEKIRLWSGENLMHSGGHNLLFKEKKYENYLCASIDMVYEKTFLTSFEKYKNEFPNHHLLGGKILKKKEFLIDSVGIKKNWYGTFSEEGFGEIASKYDIAKTVFGISGALFCIDDKILEKNEFLFEPSLHYKNDVELMLRIEKKNIKVLFFPDVLGYHDRKVSQNTIKSLFVLESSFKGQKFIMKYFPWYKKIPASIVLGLQYVRLIWRRMKK